MILDAAIDDLAPTPRPRSHRALSDDEMAAVFEALNDERFCDKAPAQIWATLFDEGTYIASVSSMYRVLRAEHQVRERRAIARHPAHLKPELVATGPNQVWSWDITKLAGPRKWTFHLYVILDVYSRYAIDWLVPPIAGCGCLIVLRPARRSRLELPVKPGRARIPAWLGPAISWRRHTPH